jgi:hypothetical protein
MDVKSPSAVQLIDEIYSSSFRKLAGLLAGFLVLGTSPLSVAAQVGTQSVSSEFIIQQPLPYVQEPSVQEQTGSNHYLGDSIQPGTVPLIVNAQSQNPLAIPTRHEQEEAKKKADQAKKCAAEQRKQQEELDKKIATAHKPVFFNNDFSYINDPNYCGFWLGDRFKRRCLPGGGWYDLGGESRFRYHGERNHRGLGLTGVDDDFLLRRNRLYGDFHISRNFRLFGEMIDAISYYENFTPRGIEENRFDMLNLFIDANLLTDGTDSLVLRTGRQELLFGAQRVISPLDWANTRRTFEGVNLMRKSKDYTIDAFWTNPVRVVPDSFDSPDRDQEFMGVYSSYLAVKDQTFDLYVLRYLNGRGVNDFKINTFGSRWQGSQDSFLWDFEGAYQSGDNTDGSSHSAGSLTFGLGRKMGDTGWKPTLWAYYDWASGDDVRGAGNGYNHLFPLAHRYNGFMDLFGRRNLEDVNLLLTMQPSKKLNLQMWYHYLFLENVNDTPYSVVMTPFNPGNAPGSADLGQEIDFLATYNVTLRQQAQLGYSHFFAGDYYATTPGVPYDGNAAFYYAQWQVSY